MKRYVTLGEGVVWKIVSKDSNRENTVLRTACQDISMTRTLTNETRLLLDKAFEKRFLEAMKLVEHGKVRQVRFDPSGRTVWVVDGRKGEYQVVPESMFCTCDDYYFRVMGRKKQLCYHLIAQQIAEALGQFDANVMSDSHYSEVTSKWSARTSSGRS